MARPQVLLNEQMRHVLKGRAILFDEIDEPVTTIIIDISPKHGEIGMTMSGDRRAAIHPKFIHALL